MKIRRIKRYSESVYKAVVYLLPQLDPDCPLPSREYLKGIIGNNDEYLLLAELDRNIIAGMLMLSSYKVPTGIKFWIDDVVVDNNFRGKGFGKALIQEAIELAKKQGARYIDLTSRPFRNEANQLYKDLGFEKRKTNVYRYII